MTNGKYTKEMLKEYGIKLLTKEELLNLHSGEWIDCDVLLQSILHAGYKARYDNVHSDSVGFIAFFYLEGNKNKFAIVSNDGSGHFLRYFDRSILEG